MLTVVKGGFEDALGRVEVCGMEEIDSGNLVVAKVQGIEQPVSVEVAWNESVDFLAGTLDCPIQHVGPVLEACESVADELDCGSVVFANQGRESAFESQGYSRQYIYPAEDLPRPPSDVHIDFCLVDGLIEDFRRELAELLGQPVHCLVSNDERPFIYSIDWSADLSGDLFKCFLHLHPMTGTAYLEELVVPKALRFMRIGSKAAEGLKSIISEAHCRYLYLTSKQRAEGFWEKQGFGYVNRLNRRSERRRVRALRRRPGWDRAFFQGQPLPNPTWCYRNHPQDDLDLYLALRDWPFTDSGIHGIVGKCL